MTLTERTGSKMTMRPNSVGAVGRFVFLSLQQQMLLLILLSFKEQACIAAASSVDHLTTSAINLALLNLTGFAKTSVLGTHMDQWESINGAVELRVERDILAEKKSGGLEDSMSSPCSYTLSVTFEHNLDEAGQGINQPEGETGLEGVCFPGNATDPEADLMHTGQPVYIYQFNETIQQSTGFDHVSVTYRPCGLRPLLVPRYDVVFYTVPMEYRALMQCDLSKKEDALPRKCNSVQRNGRGRAHFALPTLSGNSNFVANRPIDLVAEDGSGQLPAYPYEGLISSDFLHVEANFSSPEHVEALNLTSTPAIETSTYDGHFVSFRMLLPSPMVVGSNETSTLFRGSEFYVYPTLASLPSSYNIGYQYRARTTSIHLRGQSGTCYGAPQVDHDGPNDANHNKDNNSTGTDLNSNETGATGDNSTESNNSGSDKN